MSLWNTFSGNARQSGELKPQWRDHSSSVVEPLIRSWNFDLDDFVLVVRLTTGATRRFAFGEDARQKTAPDSAARAWSTGERTTIARTTIVRGAN